jgi:hypothetical protein
MFLVVPQIGLGNLGLEFEQTFAQLVDLQVRPCLRNATGNIGDVCREITHGLPP